LFAVEGKSSEDYDDDNRSVADGLFEGTLTGTGVFDDRTVPVLRQWKVVFP
jgi:hypothetical protein